MADGGAFRLCATAVQPLALAGGDIRDDFSLCLAGRGAAVWSLDGKYLVGVARSAGLPADVDGLSALPASLRAESVVDVQPAPCRPALYTHDVGFCPSSLWWPGWRMEGAALRCARRETVNTRIKEHQL